MRINLYATLRLAAGAKTVELDLPEGGRIDQILAELVRCYPALRAHLFDEAGLLYSHIHLFVNRKDITYLPQGNQTLLRPEDSLDVFPPVGGG